MKEIKFECEVITPMFLGGADGRTAELRPPSIKGAMRFWWRAVKGYSDINKLRKEEAEIFGSSDENYGKSKFSIKVIFENINRDKFRPLPHSKTKTFVFDAIKPKQKFSIVIITRKDDQIQLYENILNLTLLLGGLGKRSRRGFGSIVCSNWKFNNKEEVLQYMLEKLNFIQNEFEIENNKDDIYIVRRSNSVGNYPFIKEIRLGKIEETTSDKLLKKIGEETHKYSDPSLGYVGGDIRMASPVYVSVVKINNNLVPVITILNESFPARYPNRDNDKKQKFINEFF